MTAHNDAREFLRPSPGVSSTLHISSGHALKMIAEHDESIAHLRALTDETPWSGSYDQDWCHFCGAEPSYGPKPWTGHRDDCVWLVATEWLKGAA